jgi:hypothetical protein
LCTAVVAGDAAGAWSWAQTSLSWARIGELVAGSGGAGGGTAGIFVINYSNFN